jgi:hypothetical protein
MRMPILLTREGTKCLERHFVTNKRKERKIPVDPWKEESHYIQVDLDSRFRLQTSAGVTILPNWQGIFPHVYHNGI